MYKSHCVKWRLFSESPWNVSFHESGHSLGRHFEEWQVRFNNMNCIHMSSEILQVGGAVGSRHGQPAGDPWGSWCQTQEERAEQRRTDSLPSTACPSCCWQVCAPAEMQSQGPGSLYTVCLIETVLLRNTNCAKKGSLGRMEKAIILRLSGRCYGLNSVPLQVLPPVPPTWLYLETRSLKEVNN